MPKEIDYQGWKSIVLNSGDAEIVIPLEIGPRIVSCRLGNGPNLFYNVAEELGGKGEDEWFLRGGHRLWHSPEQKPRTYDPDNHPIVVKDASERGVTLEAPKADPSGLLKSIRVDAIGDEQFRLTHTIRSENQWPVTFAPWALTVLERGGQAAIPLLPKGSHETELLPSYSIVPWTYTDFSLPCWSFHKEFIGIDTTQAFVPQKFGLTGYPEWSAYWQQGGTFLKCAELDPEATYPDFGCCFEAFCNDFMIELETLGSLQTLECGQSVEHIEEWKIIPDLPKPDSDEAFANGVGAAVDDWMSSL